MRQTEDPIKVFLHVACHFSVTKCVHFEESSEMKIPVASQKK
jgi:hypothetical protein